MMTEKFLQSKSTEGPALLPIDTFNIKISDNGDILIES